MDIEINNDNLHRGFAKCLDTIDEDLTNIVSQLLYDEIFFNIVGLTDIICDEIEYF